MSSHRPSLYPFSQPPPPTDLSVVRLTVLSRHLVHQAVVLQGVHNMHHVLGLQRLLAHALWGPGSTAAVQPGRQGKNKAGCLMVAVQAQHSMAGAAAQSARSGRSRPSAGAVPQRRYWGNACLVWGALALACKACGGCRGRETRVGTCW